MQSDDGVLKLEGELARAVAGRDHSTIETLIAPEFAGTSHDGRLMDRKEWVAAATAERMKSAELRGVKVSVAGEYVAVVTGVMAYVDLNASGNETARVERFTHTWSQRDGRWQCLASHVTRIG